MRTVIYRISPFLQANKSPIYGENKEILVRLCHGSFLDAKQGGEKVTYLLDRCPDYWAAFFSDYGRVIEWQGSDRAASVRKMYEVAKGIKGKILFLEDDYYWRGDTLRHLWRALDEFSLVSPYDHPSHYQMQREFNLVRVDDQIYRSGPSNTHTFATTGDYLHKHFDTFMQYEDRDHPLFQALPDDIWQPTCSFATHMVDELIAPNISWNFYEDND